MFHFQFSALKSLNPALKHCEIFILTLTDQRVETEAWAHVRNQHLGPRHSVQYQSTAKPDVWRRMPRGNKASEPAPPLLLAFTGCSDARLAGWCEHTANFMLQHVGVGRWVNDTEPWTHKIQGVTVCSWHLSWDITLYIRFCPETVTCSFLFFQKMSACSALFLYGSQVCSRIDWQPWAPTPAVGLLWLVGTVTCNL